MSMTYEFPKIRPGQARYFLLSKPNDGTETLDIHKDQIHYINQPSIMLIPREYITHHSLYGLYESSLMTWIQQEFTGGGRGDKIFLDIGAHTGTFSVCLARSFASVYAFEPQKMTYYALCGSIALSGLDNVVCVNTALGSQEQVDACGGVGTLYINSDDGGTSSLHRDALGGGESGSGRTGVDPGNPIIPKKSEVLTEHVKLCVLDKYKNVFAGKVGVIKIDTEDNELEVLRGGVEVLRGSGLPYIFFEARPDCVDEITRFLKSIGYGGVVPIRSYMNMYLASR